MAKAKQLSMPTKPRKEPSNAGSVDNGPRKPRFQVTANKSGKVVKVKR